MQNITIHIRVVSNVKNKDTELEVNFINTGKTGFFIADTVTPGRGLYPVVNMNKDSSEKVMRYVSCEIPSINSDEFIFLKPENSVRLIFKWFIFFKNINHKSKIKFYVYYDVNGIGLIDRRVRNLYLTGPTKSNIITLDLGIDSVKEVVT